jgi:acyl-CoA dehydrogenase
MSWSPDAQLLESVERVFSDLSTAARAEACLTQRPAFGAVWSHLEDVGITLLLAPEDAGGFGGSWRDLQAIAQRAGFHALPLPIGETVLVHGLLARAGVEPPSGCLSFATCSDADLAVAASPAQPRLRGEIRDVPWGYMARHVLVELVRSDGSRSYFLVDQPNISAVRQGTNMAGEPRDTLVLADVPARAVAIGAQDLMGLGAFLRASQISGALECVLGLSVRHVSERSQFGRPLGQFQAIQQQLAVLAEETAAAGCAATAASMALEAGEARFEIAAAKLRANLTVDRAAYIAHQCHGAIGMTMEHSLQRSTRRLRSWRMEFGGDQYWSQWLGGQVIDAAQKGVAAESGLWDLLTARSDRSTAG